MARACSMHGRNEEVRTKFYLENLSGSGHMENLAV